ncbi:MAG: hypothetical protein HPY74_10120 [Firmicutes bacterium]|nr:hypothetical protein [Bacillota bacterium]
MNSKERVMAAVNFQKPDRMPLWNTYYFPEFTINWKKYMGFNDDINPADYYGYDVCICIGDESYFPSRYEVICEDDNYIICNDSWGRTVKSGKNAYFSQTLDTILKNPGDLDKLEFEPADSEIRWRGFAEQVERERIAGKCIYAKIGGIYIRSHTLRREEDLLADMVLDEGFCNALFDRVSEHFTSMALETLKRANAWNTGLWVYDDMASTYNTMFSPALFEKYFLPRYAKIIDTCRKAGCKHFYFHSDGNIGPIIDLLLEAGFEGFNPLEPRSGLGLVKLREKYGKKIVFFGGVCNTEILPCGNKEEIKAHVMPLLEMGREGGVILGTHTIAKDVTPEAYEYYMSLVKQFGVYL